jgi:hypothetical protein
MQQRVYNYRVFQHVIEGRWRWQPKRSFSEWYLSDNYRSQHHKNAMIFSESKSRATGFALAFADTDLDLTRTFRCYSTASHSEHAFFELVPTLLRCSWVAVS